MEDSSPSIEVAVHAQRKIMRRILPYLFLLYIINYLDRVNISFAALSMTGDLHFTPEVFGFGTGIFFVGYFLLEIPGTLLVEVWSARKWIARIMITWGMVAVLMGFMNSAKQFYWLRLGLGAAEAGFFPGIIVYLTHWFRYRDRAKVVALFMTAVPLANFIGAPISGLLLGVHWFGLAGWRWMFIVEGVPAIVLGIVTIFYLTDWPRDAKWLTEEERGWITGELAKEIELKAAGHSLKILKAFRHREVILLTLAYFFIVTGLYGFNVWLPTIVKSLSGLPNLTVTLLSALPYFVGFIALLFVGWSSDRTGERKLHSAVPMFIAGAGLLLSAITRSNVPLALAMFCIAAAGLYSFFPPFWALPTSFLSGSAAAASIGLINSFGNLGGFVGPYVVGYLNNSTNSFLGGMLYLAISSAVGGALILALRHERGQDGGVGKLPACRCRAEAERPGEVVMATLEAKVADFLNQKRIAVAGVSRTKPSPANLIYNKLKNVGYQAFAVNPNAAAFQDDPCYPDLKSIPGGIDGVVIVTRPELTAEIVRQCADAGVSRVWMHQSFSKRTTSVSDEAVKFCNEHSISVIDGACPMMFCQPVDFGHKCMRWFLGFTGGLPK